MRACLVHSRNAWAWCEKQYVYKQSHAFSEWTDVVCSFEDSLVRRLCIILIEDDRLIALSKNAIWNDVAVFERIVWLKTSGDAVSIPKTYYNVLGISIHKIYCNYRYMIFIRIDMSLIIIKILWFVRGTAEEFMSQLMPIFENLRQKEELPCSYPLHMHAPSYHWVNNKFSFRSRCRFVWVFQSIYRSNDSPT